jgi:hypothetical protein
LINSWETLIAKKSRRLWIVFSCSRLYRDRLLRAAESNTSGDLAAFWLAVFFGAAYLADQLILA